MPQHLKNDVICPNPNCEKVVTKAYARFMEESPNNVTPFSYWSRKTVIGRVWFHEDGTLCDESFISVKKLPKPMFLHLGDSTRDPRI